MGTNNNMVFHRIRKALEGKKKKAAAEVVDGNKNSGSNPYAEIEAMSVGELKSFAKINSIDISGLTKKEPIKAKIIEAVKAKSGNTGGDDSNPLVNDNPGGNNSSPTVNDNPDGNDSSPPVNDNSGGDDSTPPINNNPDGGDQPAGEGDGGNGTDGGTT